MFFPNIHNFVTNFEQKEWASFCQLNSIIQKSMAIEQLVKELDQIQFFNEQNNNIKNALANIFEIQSQQSLLLSKNIKNDIQKNINDCINKMTNSIASIKEEASDLNLNMSQTLLNLESDKKSLFKKRDAPQDLIQKLSSTVTQYNNFIDFYLLQYLNKKQMIQDLYIKQGQILNDSFAKFLIYQISLYRTIQYDIDKIATKSIKHSQSTNNFDISCLEKNISLEGQSLLVKINFDFLFQQLQEEQHFKIFNQVELKNGVVNIWSNFRNSFLPNQKFENQQLLKEIIFDITGSESQEKGQEYLAKIQNFLKQNKDNLKILCQAIESEKDNIKEKNNFYKVILEVLNYIISEKNCLDKSEIFFLTLLKIKNFDKSKIQSHFLFKKENIWVEHIIQKLQKYDKSNFFYQNSIEKELQIQIGILQNIYLIEDQYFIQSIKQQILDRLYQD